MKIIEVIKIMLTFRGDPKSADKNERLSGLYWNNFFFYSILIVCLMVVGWLSMKYIFIPR